MTPAHLSPDDSGTRTRVVILGGGPAGLGAAWQLRARKKADVILLEKQGQVGGNAGSFELDGIEVDFGSHRLHPACQPRILNDIRQLLNGDLLDRPRHGRIRLRGRWIHFPLKPLDLALRLPWSFGLGVAWDAASRFASRGGIGEEESFAGVLRKGLGGTICRDFYFPYARKIWGLEPEVLSATQARRRVSSNSLGRMVRKIMGILPGFRSPGTGRFYYPRQGFGRISEALADRARLLGADLKLHCGVERISIGPPHRVFFQGPGGRGELVADHVWSTIPLSVLPRLVDPPPPPPVLAAAGLQRLRAMILIYVVLDQPQFTPFDAHYFPESDVCLTRLSEPKNYAARTTPADRTVLCGELPCETDDDVWRASDSELVGRLKDSLDRCGLPIRVPVLGSAVRRLPHAYPIYERGYEKHFDLLDRWASELPALLSFGRQGLFAHDNTHHALAMAYAAVDCLETDGSFDSEQWSNHRREFTHHVVED